MLQGTPLLAQHVATEEGPHAERHDEQCRRKHAGASQPDNPEAEDSVITKGQPAAGVACGRARGVGSARPHASPEGGVIREAPCLSPQAK